METQLEAILGHEVAHANGTVEALLLTPPQQQNGHMVAPYATATAALCYVEHVHQLCVLALLPWMSVN